MRCSTENNHRHEIAPEQQRCVWMTAGILTYLLCDRQFDCDHCPLDHAMRMHLAHNEEVLKTSPADSSTVVSTDDDYLYSTEHCWAEQCESHVVRIGIEPVLASTLMAVKTIVFSSIGQKIKRNDPFCWIVVDETTLKLRSPLEGAVRAFNVTLLDSPHKICNFALSSGWLVEIKTDDDALSSASLLSRKGIQKYYDMDLAAFNKLLVQALPRHSPVGMTFQDGGLPLSSVPRELSNMKYFEILKTAFRL